MRIKRLICIIFRSPGCFVSYFAEYSFRGIRMKYKINNFYKMYTTKFKNGKNLLELTSYDGVSYWWSIDRLFLNT